MWCAVEVDGIVKFRPLYGARSSSSTLSLGFAGFYNQLFDVGASRPRTGPREGRGEGERGAGAPVVERLRRRRQNMFPSDAHPGRVVASQGEEGYGRNGVDKSLVPAGKRSGDGGLIWRGKEGESRGMGLPRRDEGRSADGRHGKEREKKSSKLGCGRNGMSSPAIYRRRGAVVNGGSGGGRRLGHGDGGAKGEVMAPALFVHWSAVEARTRGGRGTVGRRRRTDTERR
uniref:Uncharacterized protein n=1 Tax=Oryza rufipogon TaxID=4529 RepID=A0A0E0P793_ORYRU